MEREEVVSAVINAFENYNVEETYDEDDEEHDTETIGFTIYSSENEECDILSSTIYLFDNNNISIDYLENCDVVGQGTKILNLVEKLAKQIGSHEITLTDLSKIIMGKKYVSLALLQTLKTGQSWYNSKKYTCHSKEYEKERILNNVSFITTTKMNQLDLEDKLEPISAINPQLADTLTVKEYFTIVATIFKNWESCDYLDLLISLINAIEDAINKETIPLDIKCPTISLVYDLRTDRGVGNKRLRKTRKTRKTRRKGKRTKRMTRPKGKRTKRKARPKGKRKSN